MATEEFFNDSGMHIIMSLSLALYAIMLFMPAHILSSGSPEMRFTYSSIICINDRALFLIMGFHSPELEMRNSDTTFRESPAFVV